MPLGDLTQKQKVLNSLFGANASSEMATSHTAHLYTGNPYDDGTETDYPGYSAQTLANDSGWPAADVDGLKTREVSFPDATGAASDDVTAWVLKDGTDIVAWEFLSEPLAIDGAGVLEPVGITLYIPDDANVTN